MQKGVKRKEKPTTTKGPPMCPCEEISVVESRVESGGVDGVRCYCVLNLHHDPVPLVPGASQLFLALATPQNSAEILWFASAKPAEES